MEYLISITAIVCQLASPYKIESEKASCMDYMVNCAVDKNGDILEKKADECRERFERNNSDD